MRDHVLTAIFFFAAMFAPTLLLCTSYANAAALAVACTAIFLLIRRAEVMDLLGKRDQAKEDLAQIARVLYPFEPEDTRDFRVEMILRDIQALKKQRDNYMLAALEVEMREFRRVA